MTADPDDTADAAGDLELRSLTKRFGDYVAVRELDLTVPAGAFFALLGPSGCGKTTTLRMVAGLEVPTEGEVRLGGADITWAKPYNRPVNTVFQSYALFPHLTVYENVAFGLRRQGRDRGSIDGSTSWEVPRPRERRRESSARSPGTSRGPITWTP